MLEILIQHIQQKVDLSRKDIALMKTFFIPKKLSRKEFLLREGEICNHLAFVSSGILKSFTSDEKGRDRI
ncbi:hypothetical protein [uncultured Chryseobacterium sp.]|uniref:hypothetical protein n=1 Tax=uncultured Chryseobacterium sp. TaxID=259322 RepID=UPI0025E96C03|nr:hypothetical protein [uncultured Chryseobacterium sp.]